ncbi:MAG: hypothetical protein AAFN11_08820, partial [Chloroflexota bacterium]
GNIPADDIVKAIEDNLSSVIRTQPIELHAIYDVTEFDWTFDQFISYIKTKNASVELEEQNDVGTLREHFVGRNNWVSNLRTWWQKKQQKQTTAFTNLDDAINYINSLK